MGAAKIGNFLSESSGITCKNAGLYMVRDWGSCMGGGFLNELVKVKQG